MIRLEYTPQQNKVFFETHDKFVIVTKGRRFGATKGAINACIEWCLEGLKILWGDSVNSNIDRYFERYMRPDLTKNKIDYSYNKQSKQLTVSRGVIDFRSADRPENWEGFGYDKIVLNEAGIILKNKYLYSSAVLPMMLDNPESQLFALGVPKGKVARNGEEHPFYTLYKNAKNKVPGYSLYEYTSYDNPLLSKEDVALLEEEIKRMNPAMVEQEIYGKFVDGANTILWTPELFQYVEKAPELKRTVVAVDPSGSKKGDEVGIVTCGEDHREWYFVLSDKSGHYTPKEWATVATNEYHANKADAIVVERNYGGDMVRSTILSIDKNIRVIDVVASKGKAVRAEPVVSLYEQGRVRHLPGLYKLENELMTWVPDTGASPNRLDALVWALTDLTGVKKPALIGVA